MELRELCAKLGRAGKGHPCYFKRKPCPSDCACKNHLSDGGWSHRDRAEHGRVMSSALRRSPRLPAMVARMNKRRLEILVEDPGFLWRQRDPTTVKINSAHRTEHLGIEFDSGLEVRVARYLSDQGLVWVDHPGCIRYWFAGRWRRYFPDFYVPQLNLLIEVKPLWLHNEPMVQAKLKACKEAGYVVCLASAEDLKNA